jgi:hypothetical protein
MTYFDIFKNIIIALIIIALLFLFRYSYNKTGFKWKTKVLKTDKLATLFILILFTFIYCISWWNFTYMIGLSIYNPFIVGYFITIFITNIAILIPRFFDLNIVEVISWLIGLATIGIIIFNIFILGTLNACKISSQSTGIPDNIYITYGIYILWLILIILSNHSESLHWTIFLKEWPKKNKLIFFSSLGICIFLLGYTFQRCENEKVNNEFIVIKQSIWINNSIWIATSLAVINLVVKHFRSSFLFALMSFAMLSQCASKNDPRLIGVSSLIVLIIPFFYIIHRLF